MSKILDIRNLSVSFSNQNKKTVAVRNVSFSLHFGESIGIVGESGSGKSVTVQSFTRLLPETLATIDSGEVMLEKVDLMRLSASELRAIRSQKIGMIFQDPMTSLNPTMKIANQIEENRHHPDSSNTPSALLRLVGLSDSENCLTLYPHQLSGGMRQRIMIAIALAAKPQILIADEPTTALDAAVQLQILSILQMLQKEMKMSLIIISHDVSVVRHLCSRILIMYAGSIVEEGETERVLHSPLHPYTRMLIDSIPTMNAQHKDRLASIQGNPPHPDQIMKGCPFAERCPSVMNICTQTCPPFYEPRPNEKSLESRVACYLYDPRCKP